MKTKIFWFSVITVILMALLGRNAFASNGGTFKLNGMTYERQGSSVLKFNIKPADGASFYFINLQGNKYYSDCSSGCVYVKNTKVPIVVQPNSGYSIKKWSIKSCGKKSTCTVKLNKFRKNITVTLKATK
jgi:hypothetical protein